MRPALGHRPRPSRDARRRPRRLLSIAFTNYPLDTRVRREAEALVGHGVHVDVICPRTPSLGERRRIEGVEIHAIGRLAQPRDEMSPRAYIARDVGFVARAAVTALGLHLRRRYDVVQVHTMPDYLVAAAALPKLLGARVVLDVHDLVPELFAAKFDVDLASPVIRLLTLVERCCIGFADHALAVHRPHLDALVRHGNPRRKFSVVMNLPDARFFARRQTEPGDGRFLLLYHGTVSRRHGLETAIRAVEIARRTYDDIELLVVGEGDDVERLRGLVDERGLGDAVRIEGPRPVEELAPLFACASAGVVPLQDDAFTRYMLPVKLLEYVAVGLPVITSDTATIRAYYDSTMVAFVRPGDVADLARTIVELRGDPARRASLVRRADSFFELHSWAQESARYLELVEALSTTRGAPAAASYEQTHRVEEPAHG